MEKLNGLDWFALIILIIGGLNWGVIGVFKFDAIASIFGSMTIISRVIYLLISIASIYMITIANQLRKQTKKE